MRASPAITNIYAPERAEWRGGEEGVSWELISSPDVPGNFHGVCPEVINLEAEPIFPLPLELFGSTRGARLFLKWTLLC